MLSSTQHNTDLQQQLIPADQQPPAQPTLHIDVNAEEQKDVINVSRLSMFNRACNSLSDTHCKILLGVLVFGLAITPFIGAATDCLPRLKEEDDHCKSTFGAVCSIIFGLEMVGFICAALVGFSNRDQGQGRGPRSP